ncbi:PD-(D/E)XK nuclease family protein [Gammaproteobacteria bacterium]|nr:PD-(D/E)XK nuclease family protein [Gammaproteobacteria bacterium]
MVPSPNLFSYATSELSQDAFICWLLKWALPEYKSVNEELHACGTALITAFFVKDGRAMPSIENVEIKKQYENIDILCVINNRFPVIIEDKTNTGTHSGQLERYYNKIRSRKEFSECDIIRIFFKTHDQSNYKKIEEDGYQVFARTDFLGILNQFTQTDSDIFNDFKTHLNQLEASVQSYRTMPKEKWTNRSWSGFYMVLKEIVGHEDTACNWKYIPNQNGGFMGFWWEFNTTNGTTSHVQLEGNENINRLVFKLKTATPATRALYVSWSKQLIRLSSELGLAITKPKRLGSGRSVTVALLKNDFRIFNDGVLDMDATVSVLNRAKRILQKAREGVETVEEIDVAPA